MTARVKAPLKKSVKEAAVEAELCWRVEALGGLCEKVQVIGRRGFFDRIIFLPGRVYFVELKRPRGGRLSPHQRWYFDALNGLGIEGVVVVKNSRDIDDLIGGYLQTKGPGAGEAPGPMILQPHSKA